jgi:predicted alpha/beta hydrolase family esterase
MKNAIILHGCPEKTHYYQSDLPSESNAHWLPWLQKELMIRDISAATPEIPLSFEPQWKLWVREFERYDLTPETILVGHSAGGGFLMKYLSIHPELRVGKVVLVAPWLDTDKTIEEKDFFDFEYDPYLVKRTGGLVVFRAVDDEESVQRSIREIIDNVPGARMREFPAGYGHFTYDNLGGAAFPELRDEVLAGE